MHARALERSHEASRPEVMRNVHRHLRSLYCGVCRLSLIRYLGSVEEAGLDRCLGRTLLTSWKVWKGCSFIPRNEGQLRVCVGVCMCEKKEKEKKRLHEILKIVPLL